jgi:hypothetical protein
MHSVELEARITEAERRNERLAERLLGLREQFNELRALLILGGRLDEP